MVGVLRFAIHEDGSLRHVGPWLPLICVTEALAHSGRRGIEIEGSTLTFACINGGARYVLSGNEQPGVLSGRLIAAWSWS